MTDAAAAMDRMYGRQRHIYDASRKFYLLGRDQLIADLAPPPGGTVLEIACGTGRNLVLAARAYPGVTCYGLDVSPAMLDTARRSVARAGLAGRIHLAQADATSFDPQALFGRGGFDRVFISYALSMIPPWRMAADHAARWVAPGGRLDVVDFGDQAGLPAPLRVLLNKWLSLFDVTPRPTLGARLERTSKAAGLRYRSASRFGGYAVHCVVERPH